MAITKNNLPRTSCGLNNLKDELPNNYFIMDIKERALKYDEMVFDFNISGTFFPLIWQDETFNSFGIAAYAGDYRHGIDGSQEAVTSIAAVLSATLLGIDKSNQNGFNFVDALNVFFNEEEQVVINNQVEIVETFPCGTCFIQQYYLHKFH